MAAAGHGPETMPPGGSTIAVQLLALQQNT